MKTNITLVTGCSTGIGRTLAEESAAPDRRRMWTIAGRSRRRRAPLPADLKEELEREYGRLKLIEEQIWGVGGGAGEAT